MSSDCIVKLTGNGQEEVLYLESKGYLARAGKKIAQCVQEIQEKQLIVTESQPVSQMSDFLTVASGLDFCPVSLEGVDLADIPHVYEIEIRDNGEPLVSYRQGDKPRRSFNVGTFIKKVNKARRRASYPYKMLRQPLNPQPEPETAPSSYTSEERIEITNTIFRHMGGSGRLTAMIGMHNPVVLDSPAGLKFNFRGSRKANICKVIYNPGSDTYDLELYYYTRVRYAHCPKVYEATDVYCDMLQDLFEAETGLYLTL